MGVHGLSQKQRKNDGGIWRTGIQVRACSGRFRGKNIGKNGANAARVSVQPQLERPVRQAQKSGRPGTERTQNGAAARMRRAHAAAARAKELNE